MSPIPPRPGLGMQASRLAEILRVDHAGEMAAVAIYRGQQAVMEKPLGRGGPVAAQHIGVDLRQSRLMRDLVLQLLLSVDREEKSLKMKRTFSII